MRLPNIKQKLVCCCGYQKFSSNANKYTSIQQFNAKPVGTGYSSKMEAVSLQREVSEQKQD